MSHTQVLDNNKLCMSHWSYNNTFYSAVLTYASTLLHLHNNEITSLNPLDCESIYDIVCL